jgi:hypothetical protein
MNTRIKFQEIDNQLGSLRTSLIHHNAYAIINDVSDLKIFMEHHVFAVWDFMSLLKSLQSQLTCTTTPWMPVGDAETRFLINEIVLGEESDIDYKGSRNSHFETYLEAMNQCGADTNNIHRFMDSIRKGKKVSEALALLDIDSSISDFVKFTFEVIETKKPHIIAAVFTFGREDVIPDMFLSIVKDIHQKFPESVSIFKYYLERHIEIDGDHHSHLSKKMLSNLCGDDHEKWDEAISYSKKALNMRIKLWDGIVSSIQKQVVS